MSRDQVYLGYAMARKCRMKSNVFVKPNEQRPTDRAARGESSLLELSRVVTEEGGSQACLGYAMARIFVQARAEH